MGGANVTSLGADLRALRKTRGLTLEALAAELECSVGWLSQVERDISTPARPDLERIAQSLNVPLSLFATTATAKEAGRIVRKNHHRAIGARAKGLREFLLSPDLTDDFQVIHSVFEPGAARTDKVERPTQELAYLIEGKMDIWLDDDKFTVSAGDSFRIRDQSMRWANPYAKPAVAIWVIAPPVY
jgi:transcriptional regulator with XRE-family HTH domain